MTLPAQSSITTIDQFLQTVGTVKAAEAPLSEAGSIGGETSHPVKNVDDRLEKAKEGERSAENSADVKKDQGAISVEKAPEAKAASAQQSRADTIFGMASRHAKTADGGAASTPGSAADDQLQIGPNKQPTGEDPSVETGSAKGGKEDPGSSHPARTDNTSLDGHKYAGLNQESSLEDLLGAMKQAGDGICATIASVSNGHVIPTQPTQAQKQAGAPVNDPELARQVGWEMAGLVSGNFDKKAADSLVHNFLADTIKRASMDADNYINAYMNFRKAAEGEPPPEEGAGGGGGGAPPMPGGGGGGEEEAMLAALGGGDPAGGGGAPPPGGDPMGGGGDPMGGGGEGGGQEEQMLAQILAQLQVSPEELQQAIAAVEGGALGGGGGDPMAGGGGAPPMGGGAPPPMPGGGGGGPPMGGGGAPPPMPGMEAQAGDRGHLKSAEIHNYIREIVSRSRARKK